jgi:hypothetical protein
MSVSVAKIIHQMRSYSLRRKVGEILLSGKLKDGEEREESFGGKHWPVYTHTHTAISGRASRGWFMYPYTLL